MVSGGRNASTSTSRSSRSCTARAYSARFRRWNGREPGLGLSAARAIDARLERGGQRRISRSAPAGARRPAASCRRAACGSSSRRRRRARRRRRRRSGQRQPAGLAAIAVAVGAVLLDHRRLLGGGQRRGARRRAMRRPPAAHGEPVRGRAARAWPGRRERRTPPDSSCPSGQADRLPSSEPGDQPHRSRRAASRGSSARDALVIVLRAQLLEQLERFRIRLRALHRAVGHVGGGLPSRLTAFTSAPFETRYRIISTSPRAAAWCSAVLPS